MCITLQALEEDCLREQARLRAQVHLLETRVKQQKVKILQLLQEKEIQFLDKGEENSVIDLGGKRQYAGQNLFFLNVSITYILYLHAVMFGASYLIRFAKELFLFQ